MGVMITTDEDRLRVLDQRIWGILHDLYMHTARPHKLLVTMHPEFHYSIRMALGNSVFMMYGETGFMESRWRGRDGEAALWIDHRMTRDGFKAEVVEELPV